MAGQKLTPAEPAGQATPETSERPTGTQRSPELVDVLFELAGTLNRTLIIIGIIALGSAALAYWGAYTEHYRIAVGAFVVFGLASLAWCIAGTYVLWLNGRAIVKWFIARHRSVAGEPADGQSAIGTAGTE